MVNQEERKRRSYIIDNKQYELLIPGYPKGSNITVINTAYTPRTKLDDKSYVKDFIGILYRDNVTGAKKYHIIEEPKYTFYKVKNPEDEVDYNRFFIEKEKVIPCTCKYADILKAIAEVTDRIEEYEENRANNQFAENKKLHTDPRIFMSDIQIENYYKFLFNLSYKNDVFKLTKGFIDIETDTSYCNGQFPEPGEVPINAIAYCDDAHGIVYQFILNDQNNPLIERYMAYTRQSGFQDELKNFVINAVGGYKKAVKFGVDKMTYRLEFFDNEIDLIQAAFNVINQTVPDFIEAWNMAFDLNYIIHRIENLGYDPLNIICDPRIELRFLKFYIDERNKNNYEERGDYVNVSSYTVWLDQMIEFASRRKGRGRYPSFKLDAIGEIVAGVKKLDYSHITSDLGKLPYIDFKTFSFYNVMDVIVQKCIESSTNDLEYVFTKCLVNNTNYAKCHRQSVYLANRFCKEFFEYGYIIGNNKNLWNEKPTTKFPGAMVGDPTHNAEIVMMHVNGRPTLLVNNAVDFDYSSLYPSIILENNLAPNTQIGRIIIEDPNDPDKPFSLNEHPDMYSSKDDVAKYSRGGEFLENMISGNILEFCRRWMRLGNVYDCMDDIREYFKFNPSYGRGIDDEGLNQQAIYFVKDNMIDAISFNENNYGNNSTGFYLYGTLDNEVKGNLKETIEKEAFR